MLPWVIHRDIGHGGKVGVESSSRVPGLATQGPRVVAAVPGARNGWALLPYHCTMGDSGRCARIRAATQNPLRRCSGGTLGKQIKLQINLKYKFNLSIN